MDQQQIIQALSEALRKVFGENIDAKRFVDVTRIPLICQSIIEINRRLDKWDDNFTWALRIIIGGVIIAVLALVIKK